VGVWSGAPAESRAQCDKRSSDGVPLSTRNIFHWFCTNLVSYPGGQREGGLLLHPIAPVAWPLGFYANLMFAILLLHFKLSFNRIF